MRKELIWAGIIGISFGLIIAFGAWRINRTVKKEKNSIEQTPQPTTSPQGFKITLDQPENNDVITSDHVTVSGITKNLAWITVSGEKGDYILQAGDNGVFSQDVELSAGINQIKVTALDQSGNQSIQKVLVVFSSSFQVAPVPTPDDSSTESAIRQKVAEKVAEALNKPKAYIGVVTDIADSTIQIKTTDSQIEQISVAGDGITVINQKGTNNKTVKLTDVAIGDFIVAMGYVNSKSVLLAQRILISDPIDEPKIDTYLGTVSDTSKKSVTISNSKDGSQTIFTPDRNSDIETYNSGKTTAIKITSINIGDLVVYTLDSSGTPALSRSFFVIQKVAPTVTPSATPKTK